MKQLPTYLLRRCHKIFSFFFLTASLKNLQELLSPTVQRGHGEGDDNNNNNDDDDDNGDPGGGRYNGSYHCKSYKQKQKCDVCSYMVETSYVTSYHFRRKHAIHGRNIHLPAGQKNKMSWFFLSFALCWEHQ